MVIFQIKNWIQVKFSRPKLSLKLVKLSWTQKLKRYQYTENRIPARWYSNRISKERNFELFFREKSIKILVPN